MKDKFVMTIKIGISENIPIDLDDIDEDVIKRITDYIKPSIESFLVELAYTKMKQREIEKKNKD